MAVKRVKAKEGENLTEANIERVITLLQQQKPITKKEACEILNISYNVARLSKIIEEHKHDQQVDLQRRLANRGKPASDQEVKIVIEDYLAGKAISEIGASLFRSSQFVRDIVERVGVPKRVVGEDYVTYSSLPEQCVATEFDINETVWSCVYQAPCIVDSFVGKAGNGSDSNVYRVYILQAFEEPEEKYFASWGKPGFYAHQRAYDLGKLTHLSQYGVTIKI